MNVNCAYGHLLCQNLARLGANTSGIGVVILSSGHIIMGYEFKDSKRCEYPCICFGKREKNDFGCVYATACREMEEEYKIHIPLHMFIKRVKNVVINNTTPTFLVDVGELNFFELREKICECAKNLNLPYYLREINDIIHIDLKEFEKRTVLHSFPNFKKYVFAFIMNSLYLNNEIVPYIIHDAN